MTAKSKTEVRYGIDQGGWSYTTYDMFRSWNTQPKPWRKPLPFHFNCLRNTRHLDYSPDGGHGMILPVSFWYSQQAVNNSYEKMVGQIGDASSWGENLAEAHQSIDLMTHALSTITSATKQIKTGNIFAAAKTLGLGELSNKQQRRIRNAKSVGNRWLEYHFGFQPLMQDVHSSLQTLSKTDFGLRTIEGRSIDRERDQSRTYQYDSVGRQVYVGITDHRKSYSIRQSCKIRVSNPNAYLANQFGVVNPLTVAWNLIPYSFVVDWFSNVSQCLNAMTDFVGLTKEDAYFTTFSRNQLDHEDWWDQKDYYSFAYSNETVDCSRGSGTVGPSPVLKSFKGFSLTRAVTGISLLLQHL
jgi:hypothetical protein